MPTAKKAPEAPVEVPNPESKPDMQDLGLLKIGKSKVFVNRIPSKTNAIVVNYKNSENYYRISCVIPPHSYNINVDDDEWEDEDGEYHSMDASKFLIDTPTLLFTAQYATLPKPVIGTYFESIYSIYALNTAQTDHIAVKPYMLSNTYTDGRICMGNFRPVSLLKAYNIYWGSLFNSELFHHVTDVVKDYKPKDMFSHLLNFHSHMLPQLKWGNLTNAVCGKNHWASDRGAGGVLVTDNAALLNLIPKEFWREDFNRTPIIITLANQQDKIWHFESGNYKFQLPASNVSTKNTRKSASNVSLTAAQLQNRAGAYSPYNY